MYRDIATTVYRRAMEDGPAFQPPAWAWGLVAADMLLLLPIFLFVGYTLSSVVITLTMVEDAAPPTYEPVSLNEESAADPAAAATAELGPHPPAATTTSLRASVRTLRAQSGWLSLFRGFGCFIALAISTGFVYGIISAVPFMPDIVALAITALALVQLHATWTITVITVPSPKRFWRRLPPFKRAFSAAAVPTVAYFVIMGVQQALPAFLAVVLGVTRWDPKQPDRIPEPDAQDVWKILVVFLVSLTIAVFGVLPAHVVLARVQASLLTEEDETIVPFDRSFQGTVEPAIVGGRGYVTPLDAWKTFSRASWVRLVKMYLKIFAVSIALWFVTAAIVIPEYFLVAKYSKKLD